MTEDRTPSSRKVVLVFGDPNNGKSHLAQQLHQRYGYTHSARCLRTDDRQRLQANANKNLQGTSFLGLPFTFDESHKGGVANPKCAVLDAYGWTDLQPTCEFILDYEDEEDEGTACQLSRKKKPWRYCWPDAIRDEVLGRLLALNAQRSGDGGRFRENP
jgi:hypothetical protein